MRDDDGAGAGRLIVAAAPIGRTLDAPPSLAAALAGAPVIAAEDTRRLRRLAGALGVTPIGRLVSYYEGVEAERGEVLLAALRGGNPSKQNRSVGRPETASAAVTAEGPGSTVTAIPAATAAATSR